MNDLHQQLDRASALDAEYGHNLSSHLPMGLTALHRLGADGPQREAFMARYVSTLGLQTAAPVQPWPAGDAWRSRLGDPAAWPPYRGLFREWIAHEGTHDVLAQVLPWLMPGVGAAAFHGLLRLAYALTAAHPNEVADGLAYWACRWFACGQATVSHAADDDVAAVIRGVNIRTPSRPLIAERMNEIACTAAFGQAIRAWRVNQDTTLPALARWAAETYAASGNFTLLHAMTSAQAMQVVLPCMEPEQRPNAVACYAAAVAAAAASTHVVAQQPVPWLPWEEVIRRALTSVECEDRAHVIKAVDAAWQMNRLDPQTCWLAAAGRAVGDGRRTE